MSKVKHLLLIMTVAGLLYAQSTAGDIDPIANSAPDKAADRKAGKKKEEKKDFPDYDEVVTEDFKSVDLAYNPTGELKPFYQMYHNPKTDQLFAVINGSMLDKNFMISSSIAAAPSVAGWMWGDQVVKWQRRDKKLLLIEPDLRNEGKEGIPISDAVARTYTDRIIQTIDIKTLKGGDPVIDLGDLFKRDYGNIGRVFGGALDPSLAKWTKVKAFEKNVVLTVESPFKAGGGRGGFFFGGGANDGTLISVNYNMSYMPENGYKPREADDRIGYFLTVRRDWTKDYKAKTLFTRYVNRWNLEKQDPELAMSPVKEPIIFYIEKTVPVRFRNAVKEGILSWNTAFENCGFIDAMQVRQQTDSNEFAHYDPEDVTKNFFRWTATGVGLAVGPSRANPLTGQIYDADIVFDDGWIRGPIETNAVFGAKSFSESTSDAKVKAFLSAHPEFDIVPRQERLTPGYGTEVLQTNDLKPDLNQLDDRYKYYMCDYGADMRNELDMAHGVFEALGYDEIPDEFLQQIVKEVAAHEVGHTLGLRHNFKASSWLPLDEVLRKTDEVRPIGGSVMDYNAFMFNIEKDQQGDYAMRTIGPYDIWAIEYGYRPQDKDFKSEQEMLNTITDRVAEAGLDFATDDDASLFDPDPLVNRRDMGSDPLEYARYRIELTKNLQTDIANWAVEDGESYAQLRRRFNRLMSELANSSIYAGRYVGGMYVHRDHKADPNAREPFVLVSADKQREAMQFLKDNILAENAIQLDPAVLTKLAPGRWAHWGSDMYDPYLEYNVHDRVEMVMRIALLPLFNPFTLNRIYDGQLMSPEGEDYYSLPEHIRSLTDVVWSELDKPLAAGYSDNDPYISSVRRGLQRAYTEQIITYVLSTPGSLLPADAHSLMRMTCNDLRAKVAKVAGKNSLDDFSNAHLRDVQDRLTKALDAEFQQR